jgi:hypothetical protein
MVPDAAKQTIIQNDKTLSDAHLKKGQIGKRTCLIGLALSMLALWTRLVNGTVIPFHQFFRCLIKEEYGLG